MKFDQRTSETLGAYVYALFDPKSPQLPFYIGKGRANRVFDHARGVVDPSDDERTQSPKLRLINDIWLSGDSVIHKILRFNLSDEEALRLEATIIDMVNYIKPDTLTNEISGQGVAEGFYDAQELAESLAATPLITEAKLLVIKIERRWSALIEKYGSASAVPEDDIFAATQGDWKLNLARAKKVDYVLSVARGLVRAVFVPIEWGEAGYEERKRMTGRQICVSLPDFKGKSVAHEFSRGSQNPIRYLPR